MATHSSHPGGIVILDFGSQYNRLIARRVREAGVFSEILPYNTPYEQILERKPAGIILTGGPSSVLAPDAALPDPRILQADIPILGICYGMQLLAQLLGGKVERGQVGEYGPARFHRSGENALLEGTPQSFRVWMSHFDQVKDVPPGFRPLGKTGNVLAGFYDDRRRIYALQFHPEVSHTEYGTRILQNFVLNISRAATGWTAGNIIERQIREIRRRVGNRRVVLGLSGGVDSSVAAVLIHKAIGDRLTAIFVDTGLLRKDEARQVPETFGRHFRMNLRSVDARDRFLSALRGIADPEQKRKIIGREFVEVFSREASRIPGVAFLAQGTIYPDVIESRPSGGPSATIKSHHNVGGLPEKMQLELLEPLRELFKDEVRRIGLELGIPHKLIMRHPFPGPGLAVRIPGEVTPEKVRLLQDADAILLDALHRHGLYDRISQAFAVLLPVKSVGVMGDERTYGHTLVIRAVETTDFMTARASHLPYAFLDEISTEIINRVSGINRVLYDITSKPPATIEWE